VRSVEWRRPDRKAAVSAAGRVLPLTGLRSIAISSRRIRFYSRVPRNRPRLRADSAVSSVTAPTPTHNRPGPRLDSWPKCVPKMLNGSWDNPGDTSAPWTQLRRFVGETEVVLSRRKTGYRPVKVEFPESRVHRKVHQCDFIRITTS
jgi:hypothetical protein